MHSSLLKKQAGILRAEAAGFAVKGDKSTEERLKTLADKIERIAERGC